MKIIYNYLFGQSPCNNCLVRACCITGCDSINTWMQIGINKLKLYRYLIRTLVLGIFLLVCSRSDAFSIINNPVIIACFLLLWFLPYPLTELHIMKIIGRYGGRINKDLTNKYMSTYRPYL